MIDGDTLKIIAGIIAAAYPAVVKAAEKYRRKRHFEKANQPEAKYEAALKRLKEIDEIVEIPDHIDIPDALRDLIEERNYYLMQARHYRRLYMENSHEDVSDENAIPNEGADNERDRGGDRRGDGELGLHQARTDDDHEEHVVRPPSNGPGHGRHRRARDSGPVSQPPTIKIGDPWSGQDGD